jgi:hypothetical protein
MLLLPQLKTIQSSNPKLADSLQRIVDAVNTLGVGTAVDPAGNTAPPASISAISVQAADGIFDIAITDNSPVTRGISYFVESDTVPGFNAPHVYALGPSRNMRVSLGNLTLYWRGYSQYLGSQPSAPVVFGSPATAVVGGGAAGPPPQSSSGSGTASGGSGGSGFGKTTTSANS